MMVPELSLERITAMLPATRARWIAMCFFGMSFALLSTAAMAEPSANPWPSNESPGLSLLSAASDSGRYSYVFFWKDQTDATQRRLEAFSSAVKAIAEQADAVTVCVTDPKEKATVDAFKVARAPMPLVVAVAPNGAITKAWTTPFTSEVAKEGLVSEGTAACLKALQDDKLVLVSVQNESTARSSEAIQAALGFLEDPRFSESAELVVINPSNQAEEKFLADLKVQPAPSEAVTLVLAPPGRTVVKFVGAVSAKEIITKVTDAAAGCCPDGKCGPGQCCPGGKCGPTQKK